jgi:hypothetical protein
VNARWHVAHGFSRAMAGSDADPQGWSLRQCGASPKRTAEAVRYSQNLDGASGCGARL